jgi:hypothetical protein
MRIGHQEIVIADAGIAAPSGSSSMYVYIFAKDVVVAYSEKRFLALEFQILRLKADCRERIKLIGFPNRRRAFDDNVRLETAAPADSNTGANIAVRAYPGVISDLGSSAHNRRRMDHGC